MSEPSSPTPDERAATICTGCKVGTPIVNLGHLSGTGRRSHCWSPAISQQIREAESAADAVALKFAKVVFEWANHKPDCPAAKVKLPWDALSCDCWVAEAADFLDSKDCSKVQI